jgi:hypothetical protein
MRGVHDIWAVGVQIFGSKAEYRTFDDNLKEAKEFAQAMQAKYPHAKVGLWGLVSGARII